MKIIKNNYNPSKTLYEEELNVEVTCEVCGSVFEYDKECDPRTNEDELYDYVKCPCCGHEIKVYEYPTTENFRFPEDFYHFGSGDCKTLDNTEIREMVAEAIKKMKTDPQCGDFYSISTGNVFVLVWRSTETLSGRGYNVVVSRGYYEAEIEN